MKLFYDCEFIENGPEIPIRILSIGMVREDGSELYRINSEALSMASRHPWVSVNVLPHLPVKNSAPFAINSPYIIEWDQEHEDYPFVTERDRIAADVQAFIQATPDAELWGYYPAYDHVVLCQLFGTMAELPSGIPMTTFDIQQEAVKQPWVTLPPQPLVSHHALHDARWDRDAYFTLLPYVSNGGIEQAREARELAATEEIRSFYGPNGAPLPDEVAP